MPTRKTGEIQDAAPVTDETPAAPEAPAAAPEPAPGTAAHPAQPSDAVPEDAQDEPAPEPVRKPWPETGGVAVTYNGIDARGVEVVGLCEPGETVHVPESLAKRLTSGDDPLFSYAAE